MQIQAASCFRELMDFALTRGIVMNSGKIENAGAPIRARRKIGSNRLFLAFVLVSLMLLGASAVTQAAQATATPHPLDTIGKDASLDEWLSEADGILRGRLADRGVTVKTLRATPTELSFEFACTPDAFHDGKLIIPLAIPRGEITSTVLQRIDLDGAQTSDPATLSLCNAKAEELGYVRTFRVGTFSISVEPRSFGGRTVTGGAATIYFRPAEVVRDPTAIRFWARHRAGLFRNLVQKLVANPGDIDRYIVVPERAIPSSISQATPPRAELAKSPFRMKIRVRQSGLYRITANSLESSGVVANWLDPRHLRVFNNGSEVPLLLVRKSSEDESRFHPDDALLFYGLENPSPYSATNVYWLVYDESGPQLTMSVASQPAPTEQCASASGFMTKTVIEQDTKVLTRNDQFLSILGFRWIWHEIPTSGTFTATFDLPNFMPMHRALPAVLNLFVHELGPATTSTVCLRINGGQIYRFAVTSEQDDRKAFTVPEDELRASGNRCEIWLEAETKGEAGNRTQRKESAPSIYLDNIELWYNRPYRIEQLPDEITSPYREDTRTQRPMAYRLPLAVPAEDLIVLDITAGGSQRVPSTIISTNDGQKVLEFRALESGPRRYLVTTPEAAPLAELEPATLSTVDLRSTATVEDFIIVAHPDFVEPMKRFAERKEREGHKVLLVDTQTVYDQFAHGQETPEAIKRFLDYAARYHDAPSGWSPATFVLLVGDATSAYKNEFHNNVVNYVPSYTMRTDSPAPAQWASDHWYTRIFGRDDLADVLLGRLSVNNRTDLENILDKLERYEKQAKTNEPWRAHIGFIADHTEFDEPTKRVAKLVPPSYSTTRLSLSEEPWEDNFYFPAEIAEAKKAKVSPEMTRKIRDLFNEGASVVWYFGHGSPNIWSTQRIWFGGDSENSDNLMLRNRDRLPIVLNMTCNSGAIDYPMPRWNVCISEDFMRVPQGGAVACYVPAGPGMVMLHELLSRELVRTLFAERVEPLGAALALAGYRYLAQGNPPDMVRMFILLGDPSMNTAIEPKGGMFAKGLGKASDLRLRGWNASLADPTRSPTTVTLTLHLENSSERPVRDAVITAAGRNFELESDATCFFPGETRQITLVGNVEAGVTVLTLTARAYGSEEHVTLETTRPITLIVGGAETSQPLTIVPYSLTTSHTASPRAAEITCELANIGKDQLTVRSTALEPTSGTASITSATIAAKLNPGEVIPLRLVRTYTEFPDSETVSLKVEAVNETTSEPVRLAYPLMLGRVAMPDLTIPEGGIMPHKYPVAEGETVFFRVTAENIGNAIARNVRVDAYDGVTTGTPPLQSRVLVPHEAIDIPPHSQRVLTVRWDPFANAGMHDLLFRVWSGSIDAERTLDNNQRTIRFKVLTKYKLRPLGVTILPLTQSDLDQKQIRIAVKIRNEGEAPAHGVKVVVYGDKHTKNKSDVLAEDLIEEIPGLQTVERVLVYRPTEKDKGRRIDPWCEVFLKGSLQRVPWP